MPGGAGGQPELAADGAGGRAGAGGAEDGLADVQGEGAWHEAAPEAIRATVYRHARPPALARRNLVSGFPDETWCRVTGSGRAAAPGSDGASPSPPAAKGSSCIRGAGCGQR